MCSADFEEQEVVSEDTVLKSDDLSRRDLRALIFHLLYAAEAQEYEDSLESIADSLSRGFKIDIPFDGHAFQTAEQVINQRKALDEHIMPYLQNWRFERIGMCTRLILRYALWELLNTDTPPSIVINEAVELAKCFSEKDAFKFINGILDEIAKEKEKKE